VLGSSKVSEPIRGEEWVQTRCLNPSMLGLGCAPEPNDWGACQHPCWTSAHHLLCYATLLARCWATRPAPSGRPPYISICPGSLPNWVHGLEILARSHASWMFSLGFFLGFGGFRGFFRPVKFGSIRNHKKNINLMIF
jgi:hypothetical protein